MELAWSTCTQDGCLEMFVLPIQLKGRLANCSSVASHIQKYILSKVKGKHRTCDECLVTFSFSCDVLIKSQKVLIKLTAQLTADFARLLAEDPLFIQRLRSAVLSNGRGTRWVWNQNISASCPHFFLQTRPPELLWLKLMTKLLLAMLHHFVTVCAALENVMEKSESPSSGQELTEWTGLSNSILLVFHSEMWHLWIT